MVPMPCCRLLTLAALLAAAFACEPPPPEDARCGFYVSPEFEPDEVAAQSDLVWVSGEVELAIAPDYSEPARQSCGPSASYFRDASLRLTSPELTLSPEGEVVWIYDALDLGDDGRPHDLQRVGFAADLSPEDDDAVPEGRTWHVSARADAGVLTVAVESRGDGDPELVYQFSGALDAGSSTP